jgi:hypothetical protein
MIHFFAGQCLSRLRGHDPEGAEADGFVDQESGDGHQERGQITHRAGWQVIHCHLKLSLTSNTFLQQ